MGTLFDTNGEANGAHPARTSSLPIFNGRPPILTLQPPVPRALPSHIAERAQRDEPVFALAPHPHCRRRLTSPGVWPIRNGRDDAIVRIGAEAARRIQGDARPRRIALVSTRQRSFGKYAHTSVPNSVMSPLVSDPSEAPPRELSHHFDHGRDPGVPVVAPLSRPGRREGGQAPLAGRPTNSPGSPTPNADSVPPCDLPIMRCRMRDSNPHTLVGASS